MSDWEIKDFGQTWLLTPTSRAARTWCRFNIPDKIPMSGESYLMHEQFMLEVIEQFADQRLTWIKA